MTIRSKVSILALAVAGIWALSWTGTRRSIEVRARGTKTPSESGAVDELVAVSPPPRSTFASLREQSPGAARTATPQGSRPQAFAMAPIAVGDRQPSPAGVDEIAAIHGQVAQARGGTATAEETMTAASGIAVPPRRRSPMEGGWNSEPHDAAATLKMRDYLVETAKAIGLDAKVVKEADCGTTVCRVKLSFDQPGEAMRYHAAAQNPDFQYELKSTGPLLPEGTVPAAPPGVAETGAPLPAPAPAATGVEPGMTPPAPASGAQVAPSPPVPFEFELLLAPEGVDKGAKTTGADGAGPANAPEPVSTP